MNKGKGININGIDDELIKQTTLTYLGVILLIMVGYAFVWPRFSDLISIRSNIKAVQAKSEEFKVSLNQLDQFKQSVNDSDKELLYEAIPLSFNPGVSLINVRTIAQRLGVSIVEYKIGGGLIEEPKEGTGVKTNAVSTGTNTKPIEKLSTNGIEITVTGSTKALMDFMKAIEESTPLAQIKDVSVSTITQIITAGYPLETISLNLKIDYYYLPISVSGGSSLSDKLLVDSDLKVLEEIRRYSRLQKGSTSGGVSGGNTNLFDE